MAFSALVLVGGCATGQKTSSEPTPGAVDLNSGVWESLKAVRHLTPSFDLPTLLEELRTLCRGERGPAALSKHGVKELIAQIEPDFARTHIESEKSLDQRV